MSCSIKLQVRVVQLRDDRSRVRVDASAKTSTKAKVCAMFGANKAVNRISWLRWWASFSAFMITKHTVLANILVQQKSCILCPFIGIEVNFRKQC